jgi:hypothetical protein
MNARVPMSAVFASRLIQDAVVTGPKSVVGEADSGAIRL